MQLIPLHDEFGITLTGIDFASPVDDLTWPKVVEAMEQYSLVLVRQQELNDELQLELTRRIGTPEEEHVSYYSRGEITYLGTVGNIDEDGNQLKNQNRSVRSGTGNNMWHSDSSFREVPSSFSLLFAHEVPAEGGETEFVSTRAAYKRLDVLRLIIRVKGTYGTVASNILRPRQKHANKEKNGKHYKQLQ